LNKWNQLIELFSKPTKIGISVFLTKIGPKLIYDIPEPPLINTHSFSDLMVADKDAWDCMWSYQCIKTSRCVALSPNLRSKISNDFQYLLAKYLANKDEERSDLILLLSVFRQLPIAMQSATPWTNLSDIYNTYKKVKVSVDIENPENYFLAHRIVITASRIIFQPAISIKTNRLLRRFGKNHRIVYVYFRNESLKYSYSKSVFLTRILDMLENGFRFGQFYDLEARFLMCSSSQMREQTALFLVSSSPKCAVAEVEHIRNGLIPNYSLTFDTFPKMLSRLGLFCTSDTKIGDLKLSLAKLVDDAKASDGTMLTDGAGIMSRSLLKDILLSSNDSERIEDILLMHPNLLTTSAIQIR
jgi:hypothetical protein